MQAQLACAPFYASPRAFVPRLCTHHGGLVIDNYEARQARRGGCLRQLFAFDGPASSEVIHVRATVGVKLRIRALLGVSRLSTEPVVVHGEVMVRV